MFSSAPHTGIFENSFHPGTVFFVIKFCLFQTKNCRSFLSALLPKFAVILPNFPNSATTHKPTEVCAKGTTYSKIATTSPFRSFRNVRYVLRNCTKSFSQEPKYLPSLPKFATAIRLACLPKFSQNTQKLAYGMPLFRTNNLRLVLKLALLGHTCV